MRHILPRRCLHALLVLWAAFTLTFAILYWLPGDPVAIMLDARGDGVIATPAQIAELRARYQLDQPLYVQYFGQLGRALRGDFGVSIESGQDVMGAVAQALPHTLALAGAALLLALGGGLAVAYWSVYTRAPLLRGLLLSLPSIGISVPAFWVGLMLLQGFSFRWHLFPGMGNDGWASLVLPAFTLAIPTGAGMAQVLARSLETALAQPYVDTAYSKGASRARVHGLHALRNALIPALTLAGMSVGHLLGGSVVTETVFGRAGVGRLTQIAVQAHDIPMVQGLVVLSTAVFLVVNLAVDLLYPLLDPRLRERSLAPQETS